MSSRKRTKFIITVVALIFVCLCIGAGVYSALIQQVIISNRVKLDIEDVATKVDARVKIFYDNTTDGVRSISNLTNIDSQNSFEYKFSENFNQTTSWDNMANFVFTSSSYKIVMLFEIENKNTDSTTLDVDISGLKAGVTNAGNNFSLVASLCSNTNSKQDYVTSADLAESNWVTTTTQGVLNETSASEVNRKLSTITVNAGKSTYIRLTYTLLTLDSNFNIAQEITCSIA